MEATIQEKKSDSTPFSFVRKHPQFCAALAGTALLAGGYVKRSYSAEPVGYGDALALRGKESVSTPFSSVSPLSVTKPAVSSLVGELLLARTNINLALAVNNHGEGLFAASKHRPLASERYKEVRQEIVRRVDSTLSALDKAIEEANNPSQKSLMLLTSQKISAVRDLIEAGQLTSPCYHDAAIRPIGNHHVAVDAISTIDAAVWALTQ